LAQSIFLVLKAENSEYVPRVDKNNTYMRPFDYQPIALLVFLGLNEAFNSQWSAF